MSTQSKRSPKFSPALLGAGLATAAILAPLPSLADDAPAPGTSEAKVGAPASVAIVFSPSLTNARADSRIEQGFDTSRKFGLGGGILFDAPLTPNLSLGIGALYIERKFEIGTSALRYERKAPTVFVPVEAKIWVGNGFAVGAGAFGAIKVGDATDKLVTGTGTLQSTSPQDRKSFDYGLTVSANFLLPVSARTGIIVGARYLYGLSNNTRDSSIYDERIDDLAFNAGLSFSI